MKSTSGAFGQAAGFPMRTVNTSPPPACATERLVDVYDQFFRVVLVDDNPPLLDEGYRLRYQVYCVEHRFEDPAHFPDGLERDRYDARSLHSLLIHRPSGAIMGTVRLILPDPDRPVGSLPIDTVCQALELKDDYALPRAHTAEVSRFAVSRWFRRRIGEAGSPSAVTDESLAEMAARRDMAERRIAPHITLGLIESLVRMSVASGATHWCSVMERALLRLLSRIGIHFDNIGPQVEHHGRRQPCCIGLNTLLERVKEERFDIWELISRTRNIGPAH
jgi:N-acyl amino acid synthase of PEP-CTERM/exosortase system